jgi:hypothetical protein
VTDIFKVSTAGAGGLLATSIGWENVGAVLDLFLRLGQIGVAVVTILYIYSKWKATRASKKDDNEDPS